MKEFSVFGSSRSKALSQKQCVVAYYNVYNYYFNKQPSCKQLQWKFSGFQFKHMVDVSTSVDTLHSNNECNILQYF